MHHVGDVLKGRPRACRHESAFVARNTTGGVGVWCDQCARWVTKEATGHQGLWLPSGHAKLDGVRVADTPIRPAAFYRYCEKCAEPSLCEIHHVAPRAFFGDECERWPVVYLCRPCHEAWHAVMTPGLCTAYDAMVHAAQLFGYLGRDRVGALYRAIAAEGQPRREAA